jgi:hypothetical protein
VRPREKCFISEHNFHPHILPTANVFTAPVDDEP